MREKSVTILGQRKGSPDHRTKNVQESYSLVFEDFAASIVDSVHHLPDGQVKVVTSRNFCEENSN